MSQKGLTKGDLIAELAEHTGMTKREARTAINWMIERIRTALINGSSVKLKGFGKFYIKYQKPKLVRDFVNQKTVRSKGKNVPKFDPADNFLTANNS